MIFAASSSVSFGSIFSIYFSHCLIRFAVPKRVFFNLNPLCLGRVKHFEICSRPQHMELEPSSSSPSHSCLLNVGVNDADESFRHGDDGNELISITFHHHFLSLRIFSFFSLTQPSTCLFFVARCIRRMGSIDTTMRY